MAEWAAELFAEANAAFFGARLGDADVQVDNSWHLRGGAGGAHPGSGRIVLDPSMHTSMRDLGSTLLHEMLHLELGSADGTEEHGEHFLTRCLEINEQMAGAAQAAPRPCGLCCRLGEFDTAVDQVLLAAAGVGTQAGEAFARPAVEAADATPLQCGGESAHHRPDGSFGRGLLLGDLLAAGAPPAAAARLPALCAASACRRALEAPCGYLSWQMRSRTLARHFAVRAGRDYQFFTDYAALWKL